MYLCSKTCDENKAKAEKDLLITRRHIREAEDQLDACLRGQRTPFPDLKEP